MTHISAIGARQIRAARALLDWSQDDLADATHLSIATIRKLELGAISPRQTTTLTLRKALEAAGLEFIEHDGVRRRPDEIATFEGADGRAAFFDDMLETIRRMGGDVMMIDVPGASLLRPKADEGFRQLGRIAEANGASFVKCLLTEPVEGVAAMARIEVRQISRHYVDPMPLCVYGDKFAVVTAERGMASKIIVMRSAFVAETSRRQFLSMWEKGAGGRNSCPVD